MPFTRRSGALGSEPHRYGWSFGTPKVQSMGATDTDGVLAPDSRAPPSCRDWTFILPMATGLQREEAAQQSGLSILHSATSSVYVLHLAHGLLVLVHRTHIVVGRQ